MQQTFIELAVNRIHTRENYRKTFNDKSLKEQALSIKENGVIEPVIVRTNADGFELIAGERRFRAAQMAGLVKIPAIVRETADEDVLKLQIIENVQRENVPFMEEARALRRLRDDCALDTAEIARQIGKSDFYVFYMLKLTQMSDEAQDACTKGEISKSVAFQIAKLPNTDWQTQAALDLRRPKKDKLIGDRAARRYIEETFGENGIKRPRRNKIQKSAGSDYSANWKRYLVGFSCADFARWKELVGNSIQIQTWSESVETVMRERN